MCGHKKHIKHIICTDHTSHNQQMYGIILLPQLSQPSQFLILWTKNMVFYPVRCSR